MGILYDKTMKYKKQFVIEELHKLNVYSINGAGLDSFGYDRLKEELVHASFRQVDVESSQEQWF